MGNSPGKLSDKAKLGSNKQLLTLAQFVEKKRWEAIPLFLKENPSVISTVCDPSNGQTLCHKAMMFDVPTKVISALLELDASSLGVADSSGKYPVHYAMQHITDLVGVVNVLLKHDQPNALSKTDIEGNLPLHLALSTYQPNEECLKLLIETYPDCAKLKTKQGKMALHSACQFRAPLSIIGLLIEKNPDSLGECHRGRLPLHIACEERNPIENIKTVYEAYPEAAAFKGYEGAMPIHLSISSKASLEMINLLITAHVEALVHRDRRNKLPLHHALEKHANEDVVLALINACPEAATYRDKTGSPGNYPLATAIEKRYSYTVIEAIMNAFKQAAHEKVHSHAYAHTLIHLYTHPYTHTHAHISTLIHSYTHPYTHSCTHIYTHSCTHIYTHTHLHSYTHTQDIFGVWPLRTAIKNAATENVLILLLNENSAG